MEKISKAVKSNKVAVERLETLNAHLVDRLDISYYILSHYEGDEKAWSSGDKLRIYVAMVNPKSGRFRYFAVTEMDKSSAPTDYKSLINLASINLFDDIADIDDVEVVK